MTDAINPPAGTPEDMLPEGEAIPAATLTAKPAAHFFVDWFIAALLTAIFFAGNPTENMKWAILIMLGGIGGVAHVLKRFGIGGSAAMLIAGFMAKPAIKVAGSVLAAYSRHAVALLIVLPLLGGCFGSTPSPLDARNAMNQGAKLINDTSHAAAGVCSIDEVKEIPKAALWCDELGAKVDQLQDLYDRSPL